MKDKSVPVERILRSQRYNRKPQIGKGQIIPQPKEEE
jgi:hypothetical protein